MPFYPHSDLLRRSGPHHVSDSCSSERPKPLRRIGLTIHSGTAALMLGGSHDVAAGDAVEVPRPFGLRVVVPREDLAGGRPRIREWMDRLTLVR